MRSRPHSRLYKMALTSVARSKMCAGVRVHEGGYKFGSYKPTVDHWVCGFEFLESSHGWCGFISLIKCHIGGVKNTEHKQVCSDTLRCKTELSLMFYSIREPVHKFHYLSPAFLVALTD